MSKVLLFSTLKVTVDHVEESRWTYWASVTPFSWSSGLVKVSERNEKPVSISVAVDVSLQTEGDASSEGLKYLLGLISAQLAPGGAEQSVWMGFNKRLAWQSVQVLVGSGLQGGGEGERGEGDGDFHFKGGREDAWD